MRSLARSGNRPKPVMNVTPLVDVVLVLLIIFMVVVPMMDKTQVELPSIFNVDEDAKGKTDPFSLSVTKDGALFFEREPLEPEAMRQRLSEAQAREPARRLVLRADRGAKYGQVRTLFKECQTVGFPGISLRVNEVKKPGAKPN
jgi:biopolymer transport protein TolR